MAMEIKKAVWVVFSLFVVSMSVLAQTDAMDPYFVSLYNRSLDLLGKPGFKRANDSLMLQAIKKNNVKYVGFALHNERCHRNMINDSIGYIRAFNDEINYYLAHGEAKKAWSNGEGIVLFYINRGNYKEGQRQAYRMLDKALKLKDLSGQGYAYFNVGRCYRAQNEYAEATNYYQTAQNLGLKDKNWGLVIVSKLAMSYALRMQSMYAKADSVCSTIMPYIKLWEKQRGYRNPVYRGKQLIEQSYADLYLHRKDSAKAHIAAAKAEYAVSKEKSMESDMIEMDAAYNFFFGNMKEAVEAMKTLISIYNGRGDMNLVANYYRDMAAMYERNKDYKEATEAYKQYGMYNDSARLSESAHSLNKLRTQYEVKELKVQNQLSRQEKSLVEQRLWFSLVGCLLLILVVLMLINHNRTISQKNELLYRQIVERQKIAQNPTIQAKDEEEPRGSDLSERQLTSKQLLFKQLEKLLEERPELLGDEDLGREKLAKLLGTNTTYLHCAIRTCTDATVNGFINTMRVRKIAEVIQRSPDVSFDKLRSDYGFSSHTTFYRIFKHEFGMSPSEFRQCAAKLGE